MTKEAFGAELTKERESRQISLQDISAATRINVRFLEAIENGQFDVLPEAYIRAFVREYAEAVGLEPEGVLTKLDASMGKGPEPPASTPVVTPEEPAAPKEATPWRPPVPDFRSLLSLQNVVLAVLALVAVVLIVSTVRWGADGESSGTVSEIPFDKVVEESEASSHTQAGGQALPGVKAPKPDSLVLEVQTRDSVWMRLIVDRGDTSEYLFSPGRARNWVAENRFVLTVGNPRAAEFRLNGVPLRSLVGSDGRIRNREVTAEDLRGR
jgi:cytoskeletal protein RodZ